MKRTLKLWHLAAVTLFAASPAAKASAQSCHEAMLESPQLREQEVHVSLRLGLARTEILQTVYNPNPGEVEAIFHFPMPESAAIAEVEIGDADSMLHGEVRPGDEARTLYRSAVSSGDAAGIAQHIENGDLEIRVDALKAESEAQIRFVYYAPHTLDRGEGSYEYPARSSADLPGRELWTPQSELHGAFRLTMDFQYASPVEGIAAPGFEGPVQITRLADDRVRLVLEAEPGEVDGFATVRYFVESPAEGAIDLTAHRPDPNGPGVFMMVLTPSSGFLSESAEGEAPVLHFPGGRVSETTELKAEALSRGAQQAVLGRYSEAGRNRIVLREGSSWPEARHDSIIAFPSKEDEFPELERLWAHGRLRTLETMAKQGLYSSEASKRDGEVLASQYQVLADSNAMVILDDETFEALGQARPNETRVREERLAQSLRSGMPVWKTRVDLADAFFSPRGRQEGDCCFTGAATDTRTAYGIDLNPMPEIAQMTDPGVRYW